VVERAWNAYGRYFLTALPDVHSGIANLWLTDIYDKIGRPLTISGVSQHSTGAAYAHPRFDQTNRGEFEALNRAAGAGWHPGLFPSQTQELVIANDMLASQAAMFPGDTAFQLDVSGVARSMVAHLQRSPDSYQTTLQDLRRLAEMYGLTVDWANLPAPAARESIIPAGLWTVGNMPPVLAIDCGKAGIATVADAARLASGLLPAWRAEDFG
jgi:hypothetical protein